MRHRHIQSTMRISSLAALLAAALLPLLPPALCASDSETESDGSDLSLRLGPGRSSEPQDAALVGSPASLAPGTLRFRGGLTQHELTQLGHIPAPASSYESRMLGQVQQGAARSEASSSRPAVATEDALRPMEFRFAPMSWKRYVNEYLNQPVPPFVADGRIHPQHAINFQNRIALLSRAKR